MTANSAFKKTEFQHMTAKSAFEVLNNIVDFLLELERIKQKLSKNSKTDF